jgi:phage terminase Nu1 subunit (DNA packaging protein)
MSLPQKVSTSDLAELFGLSTRTVQKLVEAQLLKREGIGVFVLSDAIQAFVAYKAASIAKASTNAPLGTARAALYSERAAWMKLRRQEAQGALLPYGDVLAAMSTAVTVTKNRLLAIPSKVAVILANVKSPAEVMEILRREIHEALQELSEARVVAIKPRRKRDAA